MLLKLINVIAKTSNPNRGSLNYVLSDVPCISDPNNGTYTCGACPGGMTGDGWDCFVTSCDDVPEENRLACEFECEMSLTGEQQCICPSGWTLNADALHCDGKFVVGMLKTTNQYGAFKLFEIA